jgi:hypothetical protein
MTPVEFLNRIIKPLNTNAIRINTVVNRGWKSPFLILYPSGFRIGEDTYDSFSEPSDKK